MSIPAGSMNILIYLAILVNEIGLYVGAYYII